MPRSRKRRTLLRPVPLTAVTIVTAATVAVAVTAAVRASAVTVADAADSAGPLQASYEPGTGWGTGYSGEYAITNTGTSAVTGWTLGFTYNSAQLFANITMVDFACLPIGLTLTNTSGAMQSVAGLPAGGLDAVCAGLTAQQAADGNGWTDLIVTSGGQNLRALSPQNGIAANSPLLAGYYDDYVDQVWQKYTSATLTIETQASSGTVTGQVSGDLLTFPGAGSFARPTTADILSCSTGPFSTAGANGEALAIIRWLVTGNAASNDPMLSINRQLGVPGERRGRREPHLLPATARSRIWLAW